MSWRPTRRGAAASSSTTTPPPHKLYVFGYPGVPTIGMVMDPSLESGEVLEWVWRGAPRRYVHEGAEAAAARALIARYAVFPDVAGLTRWGPRGFLSFVKLADR